MRNKRINMDTLELLEDLGRLQPKPTSKYKVRFGIYKCGECGTTFKANTDDVKAGKIVSCGCYHKKRLKEASQTHGFRYHELYNKWKSIKTRCYNEGDRAYQYYGARGITMCDEWKDSPEVFFNWCYSNGYEASLSIDRKENDKGYSPDNCRFVKKTTQSRNTRVLRADNKSGYRGVHLNKSSGKWRSQIVVNNKQIILGYFTTAVDAAIAYDTYVIEHSLEHTKNGVVI